MIYIISSEYCETEYNVFHGVGDDFHFDLILRNALCKQTPSMMSNYCLTLRVT